MGVDKPYSEGRLQRELRRCCASKESRAGLPKQECKRERWAMRGLCTLATVCLLGTIALTETGQPIWMQACCLVQCVLWCAVAGLYETASDWERALWVAKRSRNAKIDGLTKRRDDLSERDLTAMADQATGFERASGNDVAEALRRELGDD